MILTGSEIKRRVYRGEITINPFSEEQIGPNSYDLCLHNELMAYWPDFECLDPRKVNKTITWPIPEHGYILDPGQLYLARTVEHTSTNMFVPMIEGRSSFGRLGLYVHVTAGFGDVGFSGCWTLEMSVIKPLRIYPFMRICQIYFHTLEGAVDRLYQGKYQNSNTIVPSRVDPQ